MDGYAVKAEKWYAVGDYVRLKRQDRRNRMIVCATEISVLHETQVLFCRRLRDKLNFKCLADALRPCPLTARLEPYGA